MSYPPNDIRLDKPLYIREVQACLRDLSYHYPTIPMINIDGIFGNQTAAAVKAAQEAFHLPTTGKVGYQTWTVLFKQRGLLQRESKTVEALGRIIRVDDPNAVAEAVQIMVDGLHPYFENMPALPHTARSDADTQQTIRLLYQQSCCPQTNPINAEVIRLLGRLYRATVS